MLNAVRYPLSPISELILNQQQQPTKSSNNDSKELMYAVCGVSMLYLRLLFNSANFCLLISFVRLYCVSSMIKINHWRVTDRNHTFTKSEISECRRSFLECLEASKSLEPSRMALQSPFQAFKRLENS